MFEMNYSVIPVVDIKDKTKLLVEAILPKTDGKDRDKLNAQGTQLSSL